VTNIADLAQLLSSDEVTQTKLADETGVILDVDSLQVFSLNETGNFLIEALRSGVSDEESLIKKLMYEFDVAADDARRDVQHFVEEASKQLLLNR